jgi:hypothetical protein
MVEPTPIKIIENMANLISSFDIVFSIVFIS